MGDKKNSNTPKRPLIERSDKLSNNGKILPGATSGKVHDIRDEGKKGIPMPKKPIKG